MIDDEEWVFLALGVRFNGFNKGEKNYIKFPASFSIKH